MHKDIFIDGYKQSNIIKDHKNFLKKIEELKPYIIKFVENNIMKKKIYLPDCIVYGSSYHSIIIINYD